MAGEIEILKMLMGGTGQMDTIGNVLGSVGIPNLSPTNIGKNADNIARLIYGIYALNQAKQYGNQEPPKYGMPAYLTEGIQRAETDTRITPYMNAMKPLLDTTLAETMNMSQNAASTSGQMLGLTSDLYNKNLKALMGLSAEDIGYNQNAQKNLLDMLVRGASEQNKQWAWDKQTPYLQNMLTAKMFEEAGMKNIFQAFDTYSGYQRQKDMYGQSNTNYSDMLTNLLGSTTNQYSTKAFNPFQNQVDMYGTDSMYNPITTLVG